MSILPIFIPHAGCPHQCVFCNQKKISGQHSAALASAKEQLVRWRSWLRPSAANEAAFYGGSFTGLPLELQEELLDGWLQMSTVICNERLVSAMTYNESMVCGVLYRNRQKCVTATDLCAKLKAVGYEYDAQRNQFV